ncbi:MAG TPA: hypothetical protein VE913_16275 [Longimicrobium sp.]|nr:hypothetical protein [Longimicrobium sp.]
MNETALQFIEAAAYAAPTDAELATTAGFHCFRLADWERAATWYHRAIILARQAEEWVWYIRGHLRLGILLFQQGYHDEARPHYLRAARALELYPKRHSRLPYLAHDYAFLLVRNALYSRALAVLDHLDPEMFEPQYRIILWGTVARAAGGMRDRARYDLAREQVLRLAAVSDEYAAAALVHVAEGWRSFGEWTAAEWTAGQALDTAIRRSDGTANRLAYALLDRIAERAPADRDREVPASVRVADFSRALARRIQKKAASKSVSGAALGSDAAPNLTYCAGSGQGTITKPPDPIDPPF